MTPGDVAYARTLCSQEPREEVSSSILNEEFREDEAPEALNVVNLAPAEPEPGNASGCPSGSVSVSEANGERLKLVARLVGKAWLLLNEITPSYEADDGDFSEEYWAWLCGQQAEPIDGPPLSSL